MDIRFLLPLSLMGAAAGEDLPNIVLFVVDDMGLMDTSVPFMVGADGKPQPFPLNAWYRTPNMERLAAQGIRFPQFYAQGVSSPSRASLLTGQDAARHRTTNWIRSESNNRDEYGPYDWNWLGLKGEDLTLPRILKEAGYRTIHVGKAHFGPFHSEGEDPLNLGFDVNIAGSSIGEPGSYFGENGYGLIRGVKSRAVPGLEKYHGTDTFLTEALTLEAKAQVDTAIALQKPFFLYLSHYAVHNPFETDRRFAAHYADTSYTP
ncbi:MAG: sulfatase-like hydrolase/transferase, partial [Bacteroidales bacterium]|nr:sulfatase-like hydrolase/transferase [Bacteroidales bacterium]